MIVWVNDLTDWWDSIKKAYWKWLNPNKVYRDFRLKPFDCSLCGTLWIGLLYLWINGAFTIPLIAYVCLLAYLTPVTYNALILIRDIIMSILNKIKI